MEVWLTAGVGIFFGAAACALVADLIATQQFPPPAAASPAAVATAQDPHALARTGLRLAITYALSVPLALVALRLLLDDRARPDADLRLSARRLPAALAWSALALPVVLAVSTLASLALVLLEGTPPPAVAHNTLAIIVENRAEVWAWVIVAATTLAVPIVEEVLYRGVIQSAILRATGSTWGAVGATSLLFALVHWPMAPDPRSLAIMLPTLASLSVLMGLAYERTRSLAVPVVMHAAFNALNVALAVALG
jgi:membrane protease YdiL (CAAX protease family)